MTLDTSTNNRVICCHLCTYISMYNSKIEAKINTKLNKKIASNRLYLRQHRPENKHIG